MEPAYHLEYAAAEQGHWWFVSRRRILEALLGDLPRPRRILAVGTGPGEELRWLSRWGGVVAVDLHREGLGAGGVCGDAGRLPLRAASVDWACAFDVLEHLEDDVTALRELSRVCRPGGRILLTVPAIPWLWSEHDRLNRHVRRYRAADLKRLAAAADCRILRLTHFHAALLLPAVPLRLLQRLRGPRERAVSDLARSARVPGTGLLASALAWERHLLRRADLPLGLSLFAILERG